MTQTAVEWLFEQLFNSLGIELNEHQFILFNEIFLKQAKEMEEQQTKDAIKNELKLIGNYFDVSKLETKEQKHHIRFTAILKDRFDYYNQTHGGNK